MAVSINSTGSVASVRSGDPVRIDAPISARGLERVGLDFGERSSETHCLVALPAITPPGSSTGGAARFWATVRYDDPERDRVPFMLYAHAFRDGEPIGEQRVRFFAGAEACPVVLDLEWPDDADRLQLVLYADRGYRGSLSLDAPRLVVGTAEYRLGPALAPLASPVALERHWRQEGSRVICHSVYGEHWADMPPGWRLDEVHPAALATAEWLLYAAVDRSAFGIAVPPPRIEAGGARPRGTTTLLSYSLGTDSTAAMTLLPDDTIGYYCRRPYTSYLSTVGAAVALPDPTPWEERLERLTAVTVVPTTFERIRLAGGRHGFAHSYGYAAIGLLLADHFDAGVLAFGSVMEQVFLRSGNLFADVVAIESSSFNSMRRLLEGGGLFFALPTGGCSEVLTNRISEAGRHAGLAISCPRASADGLPCRTCFKCFRKLRIDGATDLPEPDEGVHRLLEHYPLKSATSVVYAAQRSGYRHRALDEYRDVELDFLERAFPYALDHMLPPAIAAHARAQLAELGIEEMSAEDELRLRLIGQIFWPEAFSWSRAGIAEPSVPA